MSFRDIILKSQVFVSLCSALLGAETFIITDKPIDMVVLSALFFSTLLIYNTSIVTFALSGTSPVQLSFSGHPLNITLAIFSMIMLLIIITLLSPFQAVILLATGFFAVAYMMPFTRKGKRLKGIRNYTVLKNIILSLVWTSGTVLIPLAAFPHQFPNDLVFMVLRRFIFIYGLTVIYDIRDIEADKAVGLRTITIWLGEKKTRLVAMLALCSFVLLIAIDPELRGNPQSTALYLSALFTIPIILGTHRKRRTEYYSFIIDGAMIVQFALVLLFSKAT